MRIIHSTLTHNKYHHPFIEKKERGQRKKIMKSGKQIEVLFVNPKHWKKSIPP